MTQRQQIYKILYFNAQKSLQSICRFYEKLLSFGNAQQPAHTRKVSSLSEFMNRHLESNITIPKRKFCYFSPVIIQEQEEVCLKNFLYSSLMTLLLLLLYFGFFMFYKFSH